MSLDSERENSLTEDLQRCRRLVASMRGQVLASSVKQQVLRQLVVEVNQQQKHQQWWNESTLDSPRECYLRERRIARLKLIQKRWRRHMLQKRIMAKLRLEQRWRSRQGISRFRKAAVTIQRIFRGFFVRKHKLDIASYLQNFVSRIERLRSDREVYHFKYEHLQQELEQVGIDLEFTQEKIPELEKAAEINASRATKGGRSMNNNVPHADVSQEIEHYKSELANLEELAQHLEREQIELAELEPIVHEAAALIQALYRGARCRMERKRELQRQRKTRVRMLQLKDKCYERMDLAWKIRNQHLWEASARIIAGLYHIRQAKMARFSLRRIRASKRIVRLYHNTQARLVAKKRLRWKQMKCEAKLLVEKKLWAAMKLVLSAWMRYIQEEKERRKIIAERVTAGLARWRGEKVKWFLSVYRKRVVKREKLACEVMDNLAPSLLHHIRTVIQSTDEIDSTQTAQAISCAFLQQVRNDIWTWQVPDQHLYFLAVQYRLPLDLLPLKQILLWLSEGAPTFVDLYAPLPTQTLKALAYLSPYFALHSRILEQIQRVHEVYEAHMLSRDYLAMLYTANIVRLSPATTFSSHQRQRAVQILREKDQIEYVPAGLGEFDEKVYRGEFNVRRNDFTSFHCHWNHHLCEGCLAVRPGFEENSRRCKYCGHRLYENNTMARDLRLEALELALDSSVLPLESTRSVPQRTLWSSPNERCDFVVLNAFLHALAPVGHENRRTKSLDYMWKRSMANSYIPVAELYKSLPTGSLNDLLNMSQEDLNEWSRICCPLVVYMKLSLFLTILKQEWTWLDARLAFEAHTVTTGIPSDSIQLFRSIRLQDSIVTNSSVQAKSFRKNIKPRNTRLKPLNTNLKPF